MPYPAMCLYYYHFLEVEFAADLLDFVLVAVVAAVAEAVLSVDHLDDGDDDYYYSDDDDDDGLEM